MFLIGYYPQCTLLVHTSTITHSALFSCTRLLLPTVHSSRAHVYYYTQCTLLVHTSTITHSALFSCTRLLLPTMHSSRAHVYYYPQCTLLVHTSTITHNALFSCTRLLLPTMHSSRAHVYYFADPGKCIVQCPHSLYNRFVKIRRSLKSTTVETRIDLMFRQSN